MAVKVALFANDTVGLEVCRHLICCGDKIVKLYIHSDPSKRKLVPEIIAASGCAAGNVIFSSNVNKPEFLTALKEAHPEFIITVFWAYLLKPEVFTIASKGAVNFHPALLPLNRGWYPHVHNITDGSPAGVTLHVIEKGADTGPIWAQKEVPVLPTDTSLDLYKRLQEEIIFLFKEKWDDIRNLRIKPVPQNEMRAVYHDKKEVDQLDPIDLDETTTARKIINILRARTFGNRGFAYFLDEEGRRVFVNIRLNTSGTFLKEESDG